MTVSDNNMDRAAGRYDVVKNESKEAGIRPTRQVTRATHMRNRVCPRVELILKIIIILLIIFLGFIKSKPC